MSVSLVLILEMSFVFEYHRDAVLVARFDRFLVADGTARLDDRRYARLRGRFDAVGEREESVRCHYGTGSLVAGVLYRELERGDAVRLSGSDASRCAAFASTIPFDFVCLTAFIAKRSSSSCSFVGAFSVTTFKSASP